MSHKGPESPFQKSCWPKDVTAEQTGSLTPALRWSGLPIADVFVFFQGTGRNEQEGQKVGAYQDKGYEFLPESEVFPCLQIHEDFFVVLTKSLMPQFK